MSSLCSAKAAAALGPADLSSVTAYTQRHASALEDNATLDGLNQTGYANAKADPVWLDQTVLSQELRLASSDRTARLSWIVGASYVHAHYEESQDIANSAATPVTPRFNLAYQADANSLYYATAR